MGQASVEDLVDSDPKFNLHHNDGLYLDIQVQNISVNALIDTGSTVSIIHTQKFGLLPAETQENILPTNCVLRMADGGPVSCKGKVTIPLCRGDKTYHQQVLIAEIEAPFVLGYDFLYNYQCSLDISKGQWTFEVILSNAH